MKVTLSGIVRSPDKLAQLKKAASPMEVTFSGIVRLPVNPEQ